MKRALVGAMAVAVGSAGLWLLFAGADVATEPGTDNSGADQPGARQRRTQHAVRASARRASSSPEASSLSAAPDLSQPDHEDAGPDASMPVETRPVMIGMNRRNDASEAFRARDYERARALALEALAHLQRDGYAHRIVAISSCELGDRDSAQSHAEMLDRRRFERIQARCAKLGISLIHPYDPPAPKTVADAGP